MIKAIAVALVATLVVLLSNGFSGVNTNRAIGRAALFLSSGEILAAAGVAQVVIGMALFAIGKR
jgi:hypothetical protein